jgi:hypothetical protein
MNGRSELDRFLQTDPRDVGCDQAMEMLHIYVDLVVRDATAAQRYPGVAAHLHACGPCSEDFQGLLAAVSGPAHGTAEDPSRTTAPPPRSPSPANGNRRWWRRRAVSGDAGGGRTGFLCACRVSGAPGRLPRRPPGPPVTHPG